MLYDIALTKVKHNGMVKVSLRNYDTGFEEDRRYIGYTKRQAVSAILKEFGIKRKQVGLLIEY